MRKTLLLLKGILCLVLSLAVLSFAVLCLWAVTGPRDLTPYAGYVEGSINGALKNAHIKIGRAYVEWGSVDELLSVKVGNVEIFDNASGQKIATLPQVVLKYGITSVVTGYLIPSEFKLIEPEIDLTNLLHKGGGKGISLEDFNLKRLDRISVINATLLTKDKVKWNISDATMWSQGNELRLSLEMARDDGQAIEASLHGTTDLSEIYGKASFKNFASNNLVDYVPEIAPVDLIVNGRVSYTANKGTKRATFDIDKFKGEYNDPKVFKYKLKITDGVLAGSYDFNKKFLSFSNFKSHFADDMAIAVSGDMTDMTVINLEGKMTDLRTSNIKQYWPNFFGQNALAWMSARITGGAISEGTFKMNLKPGDMDAGVLPKDAFTFKFNFNNVNADYVDRLTPVTNASGTGILDGDSMKISVPAATLGNSRVTNADATIYSIGRPGEILKIAGHVEGPSDDLADFYMKLNPDQRLIRGKADISGKASSDVTVSLPLIDHLKTQDVQYTIKAQLNDSSVKKFFGKLDVDQLKMTLDGNNKAYSIKGQGLASYGAEGDDFTLKNTPVSFDVEGKNNQLGISFVSDITASPISFAPLEINKPAGEPGRIMAQVIDSGDANPVIKKLIIDSKPLQLAATGSLKKDYSSISVLNFSSLQFGKTSLAARLLNDKILTAELKGSFFDAGPIIRFLKKKDGKDDDMAYKLMLKADEVALLNGRALKDAQVTIECGATCDVINIDSKEIAFNQSGGMLRVKTEDAGMILDGFDIYSNMVKGKMEITASAHGGIYDGTLLLTDFNIVKARMLAHMLTLGSLTGIADILRGNGISFKKLTSTFHMDKHQLSVTDYRMVGAAIGITANGSIDRDKNIADVTGNIIPAYTANTLLGNIPLIGPAIIGDQGVFALSYKLTGNADDPKMSVNPLSALTPGFIQKIFH